MTKVGFIFPGQGSQYVGMGKDLYDNFDIARETYDEASEVLGFDLAKISFEGPDELLRRTRYAQPGVFVHSISAFGLVSERGLIPEAVAGHSLGEYSAFVAAGSMPFPDALRLVDLRARLMDECSMKYQGTMAAIIGLGDDEVIRICEQSEGVVVPANFNCPGQVVVSGEEEAVSSVSDIAIEKGAKRAVKLSVSGAFHSPLMRDAAEGMRDALRDFNMSRPTIPVFENVSSDPVWDTGKIKELLVKQIESPVMWSQSIFTMMASGVDQFFEIGPGNVLTGLMRRIDRRASVKSVGKVEDLEKISR